VSHPESYYEAKAIVLATLDHAPRDAQMDALLAGLGWPTPPRARDTSGRIVKVFHNDDLRPVLSEKFRKDHPAREFNSRYSGVVVAANKADAADKTQPPYAAGRYRTTGISELQPTDLRYPLAIENPDKVVIQIEIAGRPDGERILHPLSLLWTPR
jgi:hypothetical protein